jgi:Major Facilitator Superfamily
MFPMFVFLSLYMQQVLGYSAIRAGLAFLVIAGGLIASSALAQGLVTRVGARLVLTAGLLGLTVAQVLFARLPAAGHFTAGLLPGFVVVAAALGLAFVGDVIASTAGIRPADAGLASGLINTSQQIGGAIGLAVATSVAAARTAALLRAGHPKTAALADGFHDAFMLTGGLALAAALVAASLVGRARPAAGDGRTAGLPCPAEAALAVGPADRDDG